MGVSWKDDDVTAPGDPLDLDAKIARYGWAVTGVVSDLPEAPHWLYTVGNHAAGFPELILFGEAASVGAALLNRLADSMREGRIGPRADTELPGMVGEGGRLPIRFGPVRPEWAERFGVRAGWHQALPPAEVPFLQVVVPDLEGRFAEDPRYDAWSIELQPDLSRPGRPWLGPVVPRHDEHDGPPVEGYVPVPILSSTEPEDREELVAVRRDDRGCWVVARPAVLATTVTVGAVLAFDPEVPAAGRHGDLDVLPLAEVAEPGWWRNLHFRIGRVCGGHRDGVIATVRNVLAPFAPDVALTFGRASVHVAAHPGRLGRVGRALRPLVRDGYLNEIEPYDRASCTLGCPCPP